MAEITDRRGLRQEWDEIDKDIQKWNRRNFDWYYIPSNHKRKGGEVKLDNIKDNLALELELLSNSIKESKRNNEFLSCLLLKEQEMTIEWVLEQMEEKWKY